MTSVDFAFPLDSDKVYASANYKELCLVQKATTCFIERRCSTPPTPEGAGYPAATNMKYELANETVAELRWKEYPDSFLLGVLWMNDITPIFAMPACSLTLHLKHHEHFAEACRLVGITIPDLPFEMALNIAFVANR